MVTLNEGPSSESHPQQGSVGPQGTLSAGGLGHGFESISGASEAREGTPWVGHVPTRNIYFLLLNLGAPNILFFNLLLFKPIRKGLKSMMTLS